MDTGDERAAGVLLQWLAEEAGGDCVSDLHIEPYRSAAEGLLKQLDWAQTEKEYIRKYIEGKTK